MTETRSPLELEPEDEWLVEVVRAHCRRGPLTPARRAALDEALWARIHETRRPRRLAPALVVAALAAALFWLVLLRLPADQAGPPAEAPSLAADWELQLFYGASPPEPRSGDTADTELLPEEYLAIASVFFDG